MIPRFARVALCALLPVLAGIGWLAGGAARADEAPPGGGFSLPLKCTLDRDCWIINLPDDGRGEKVVDYKCGNRTYNGHEGTDFGIRDFLAVDEGVPVVATADGIVTAARDGTPDHYLHNDETRKLIGRKACGNAVIVQHAGGWESLYCHMRKGSVSVKPGDRVDRGDKLGLVGMSGRTQFPHVHVEFRHDDRTLDPFTGAPVEDGCHASGHSLWLPAAGVHYPDVALYAAGFIDHSPSPQRIWSTARSPVSMLRHAPALVLWAAMFGVEPGDILKLRIVDPAGATIADRVVRIDRHRARMMAYVGRQLAPMGWAPGKWRGEATLERTADGRTLSRRIIVPLIIR